MLAWEHSNTLDTGFGLEAVAGALRHGQPPIFNTDQGVQCTRQAYASRLEQAGIQRRWDGRGRALECATGKTLVTLSVPSHIGDPSSIQGQADVLRWSPEGAQLALFSPTLGARAVWHVSGALA